MLQVRARRLEKLEAALSLEKVKSAIPTMRATIATIASPLMTSSSSINLSRRATRTLGDVCKLVEEGFDYFTEMPANLC